MGAAVRIDEAAFGDSRIRRLARLLEMDEFGALGRLVHVWRACTDRETDVLAADAMNAIVDHDGFSTALVQADLGEKVESGVRIKGCRGRIEWLTRRREAAKSGGESRARGAGRSDAGTFQPNASQTPAKRQPSSSDNPAARWSPASQTPAKSSPPSPSPSRELQSPSGDCAPATPSRSSGPATEISPEATESPPLNDRSPTRVGGQVALRSSRGGGGGGLPDETRKASTPQGELWTHYATLYAGTYGEDPAPTKEAFAQFARLAKATGLEAAKRRLAAAFARPPSWIEGRLSHRAIVAAWDSIGDAAKTADELEAEKLAAALDRLAEKKRVGGGTHAD